MTKNDTRTTPRKSSLLQLKMTPILPLGWAKIIKHSETINHVKYDDIQSIIGWPSGNAYYKKNVEIEHIDIKTNFTFCNS